MLSIYDHLPSPSGQLWLEQAWHRSLTKVRATSQRIGDSFPHVSKTGRYDAEEPHWWTNGFWPGLLWLFYRETEESRFLNLAESCEKKLDTVLWGFDELHHDVGFMWMPTSVARYKLLGADDSRRRALLAASILSSRFNLRGSYIRAWNEDKAGWAIIDCLMNLPLLFWASEATKDPRFSYIAMAHADMALKHVVRLDGSCRHIVSFDSNTGEFLQAIGGQGYSSESAWARGASWALYGYALCYRYTKEPRYLEASCLIADFFISNLGPEFIPVWDFRAPRTPDIPWDSSAGACAASGLLELASLCRGERATEYQHASVKLLRALDSICGAWDKDEEGLLLYGTGNKPRNLNVHVPLIYGDYFFVEALTKLRGQSDTFW
jgi:unsaturated chondroitin disaccharide hydrolase